MSFIRRSLMILTMIGLATASAAATADDASCTPMIIAVPEALAHSPLNEVIRRGYDKAGITTDFKVLPNRRTAANIPGGDLDAILVSAEPRLADAAHYLPVPVPVARVTYYLASRTLGPKDVQTLEDITRYRLVLPSGFTHMARMLGHRRWEEMGTYDGILKLLQHDRADLALGTLSFARYAARQDSALAVFPAPIAPRLGYHMVRPACRQAFAAIKAALADLVMSGDAVAIYEAVNAQESAITADMLASLGADGGLEPGLATEAAKLLAASE